MLMSLRLSLEEMKTPAKVEPPRNSYGLRRRGRKPKKSKIFKEKENFIYSYEKEEDMHKLDDSEFKLPNEHLSKKFTQLIIQPNLEK